MSWDGIITVIFSIKKIFGRDNNISRYKRSDEIGIAQIEKEKNLIVETWLVTWYGDISSCKRFHWLHDGQVVCRHNFILYSNCRAANFIHSHFPTLRKVGLLNNQLFSPLLTLLCQNKFWPKIDFGPKFSKSGFCKDFENSPLCKRNIFQVSIPTRFSKTHPAATSIHPASASDPATRGHESPKSFCFLV